MKKNALLLLIMAAFTMLPSCKKDLIWDVYPVVMTLNATVEGHEDIDLLDSNSSFSFDISKIKAIYKGQEYLCNATPSKAIMPQFRGLTCQKNITSGKYELCFGEFEGAKSYQNEEITIVWPNGKTDIVSFNRDFRWKRGEPNADEQWFLNGQEVSGAIKIAFKKDSDVIYDFTPIAVRLKVIDKQGNNLLDPKSPNAIDLTKVKAKFQNKEYTCTITEPKSKAVNVDFYGLKAWKHDNLGYILGFGELDATQNYKNETVTILWPDGKSDTIKFNHSFTNHFGEEPKIQNTWWLNEVKLNTDYSSSIIEIIK